MAVNRLRLAFAGTPAFAVPALTALVTAGYNVQAVYTQPDRPAGRGRKPQPSPVKNAALDHDLAVYQPPSLRDADAQQALAALSLDAFIVAAYGLILPPAVLNTPRLGCINIHASLLPRWRGAAPIQRAILAGDSVSGVSIMAMAKGLDTGPVYGTKRCPITPDMTANELHDRLAELGAEALLELLPAIAADRLTPQPQNDDNACYADKLDKAEARIDWQRPALELQRRVMAFNPWPMAYTLLADSDKPTQRLRLLRATALAETAPAGVLPGTIIAEPPNSPGIDVATGDGVLRITELQLAGKKPLPASAFSTARSLYGQRFAATLEPSNSSPQGTQ